MADEKVEQKKEVEQKKDMKLGLTQENCKVFSDCINAVSTMVNEGVLEISKEGLKLVALDPANVCMTIFNFGKENFTEYPKIEESHKVGLNLINFKALLRRMGGTVTMTFGDKIMINSVGAVKKEFSLPIIDMEDKKQNIPTLDFKIKVGAKSNDFSEVLQDLAIAGDSVRFEVKDGKFHLESSGDLTDAKVEFSNTMVEMKEQEQKAKYSQEYLAKIMEGGKISDDITIQYSKDFPTRITFRKGNVELSYILAPRVEND